jgi:diguanylate cyclase (GGDEF)-like protein
MSTALTRPRVDDLRADARAAVLGLRNGEVALHAVLADLEREKALATGAYRAIVRSLAAALEARDGYTGDHSGAVHELSQRVALQLGLGEHALEEIGTVALLHDVGKIGVPDAILHKAGPLSAEEWELMRMHPVIGERILAPLPGMAAVAAAVRHEHERWDGTGYPDGLAGTALPLASRVVLACDAWHAMVSDRPYRPALAPDDARAELEAGAGRQFDPTVVEALLACLDGASPPPAEPAEPSEAEAARPERELHALLTVAAAVAGAHSLDDVIEVAAESARAALGAASLSISRWDREIDELRTLINVGELGPGEERRPAEEVYRLADYPDLRAMLLRGLPHRAALGDPDSEPHEIALLRELDKASSVAVPVIFAGSVWGEMYGSRSHGHAPFADRDVRFLEAISGQVAAAVGRGELFSRLSELAFEDALTGLANRRALDERLEAEVAAAAETGDVLALVVGDLDGLKETNDRAGHAAGDRALVAVADAFRAVAQMHPDAFVARLSGDEFALLLPRAGAGRAAELGQRVIDVLAAGPVDAGVSIGVAGFEPGGRPADLLRAADAALYVAKRAGRGRVSTAGSFEPESPRDDARRARRDRPSAPARVAALIGDGMAALDRLGPEASVEERLGAVLLAAAGALDAPGASLSRSAPGSPWVETLRAIDLSDPERPIESAHERFTLADYPLTAAAMATGGAYDATSDPTEASLLAELGFSAGLGVGAPDRDGVAWLLEVWGDHRTAPLADAAPALRALAAAAVR